MRTVLLLWLVAGCDGAGSDERVIPDGLACVSPTFDTEVITRGNVAGYTTYRIGPDGAEHVLYRDDAKDSMMYGTRATDDAAWDISPVPCRNIVYPPAWLPVAHSGDQHLVVTPNNEVHVSCLRHVLTKTDHGWSAEEVVPPTLTADPNTGVVDVDGTTLDVAPDGTLHALAVVNVWNDAARRSHRWMALEHWRRDASGWTREEIHGWSFEAWKRLNGLDMSLCFGPEGPRAGMSLSSYWGSDFWELRPGAADDGEWAAAQLVTDKEGVIHSSGLQPTCAVDLQGRSLQVGYKFFATGPADVLQLVQKGEGSPEVLQLAVGGRFPAIAVNGDRALVSYQAGGALRLSSMRAGRLDDYAVDDGDVGSHTSMALDHEGRPHIAYRDDAEATLKIAVGRCD